jgi:hypothetical protein
LGKENTTLRGTHKFEIRNCLLRVATSVNASDAAVTWQRGISISRPHQYGKHETSGFPVLQRTRWRCRSKRCTSPVLSSTCRTNETSRSRRWWQRESDRSWRKLGSSPHRSRSEHLHPQPWRQSDYLIHYSERSEQPHVVQQLLLGGRSVYTTRTITLKRRRFRKPSPPSSLPHTHMYRATASR